jgi:hypothetical protein
MSLRQRLRVPFFAAVLIAFGAIRSPAADDPKDETKKEPAFKPVPLAVINVAGADRSLSDTQFVFDLIERPDVFDMIRGVLGDKADDLKGLDRSRPLGALIFLEAGLPPRPMPVMYAPVTNIDELTATLARMGFTAHKQSDPNRYEISGPGPTNYALVDRGYIFMTTSETLLDYEMPDPVKFNESLTTRYDVAASLRLQTIPPLVRKVFLSYFRAQMEADLQRRDNESESSFKARRANGVSTLESIEELLTQGDQFTIGIDANQSLKKMVIELNLLAAPNSDYAKILMDVAGGGSMFNAVQQDSDKPLTASISWKLNKREKKAGAELVEALRLKMEQVFTDNNLDVPSGGTLCDVLKATVDDAHLDAFLQIAVPKPGNFVITGAVKLNGADAAGTAMAHLLSEATKIPTIKGIDVNADSHQNVGFSRISPDDSDDDADRFFGGAPGFWFGAGQRAFWFTAGADEAMPTLKKTMDLVLAADALPGSVQSMPFVLVFRQAAWMSMPTRDGASDREQNRRSLQKEAFTSSNDKLRIETRPTDNGLRTRVELDEGFIRWLGLALAQAYDRSQL